MFDYTRGTYFTSLLAFGAGWFQLQLTSLVLLIEPTSATDLISLALHDSIKPMNFVEISHGWSAWAFPAVIGDHSSFMSTHAEILCLYELFFLSLDMSVHSCTLCVLSKHSAHDSNLLIDACVLKGVGGWVD